MTKMENDMELKSCPFCGGKAQLDQCYDAGMKRHTIWCQDCKVMLQEWQVGDDKSKIIAKWNRRTQNDKN